MNIRTPFARFGWLLAAALQILLPTVASTADARAEAESIRGARVHVEASGTTGCPRVHPADCLLCRALSTGARLAHPVAVAVAVTRVVAPPPLPAAGVDRGALAPGDPPQRAPPRLS